MVFLNNNSEKSIYYNLTTITGLGSHEAKLICKKFGFQWKSTFKDLENTDLEQLKTYLVNNYVLDTVLTKQMNKYVKKKIDLGTYQGKRHNLGYPVRGQRTLSNGKTQKKLHKFRFYYDSDLFSHNFFKNQRKSKKKKKLIKIQNLKKKKETKYKHVQKKFKNTQSNVAYYIKKKKTEDDYHKKLKKIKEERKLDIDRKFKKNHLQAQKTHPYFVNIRKAKEKKQNKKNKSKL
jgi:small subunit ribosomal protein S13